MSNKFLNLMLLLSISGSAFCGKGSSLQKSNRLGSGLGQSTIQASNQPDNRIDSPDEVELRDLSPRSTQHGEADKVSQLSFENLLQYMPEAERPNYGIARNLSGLAIRTAKSIGLVSQDTSDSLDIPTILEAIQNKKVINDRDTANRIQAALNRCLTHKDNPEDEMKYANIALIILNAGITCDVNCTTTKAVKEWVTAVLESAAKASQIELTTKLEEARSHLTQQQDLIGRGLLTLSIAQKLRCDDKESFETLRTKMDDVARRIGMLDLITSDLSRDKKQEDPQSSPRLTDAQQAGPSQPQKAALSNVSSLVLPASASVPAPASAHTPNLDMSGYN